MTTLHSVFDEAENGVRAVESLLHHGARTEDIELILPHQDQPGATIVGADSSITSTRSTLSAPAHHAEVVTDLEQGLGVGAGAGLVAAMCIPGLNLISGAMPVVGGMIAAGAVVGAIAGSVYGYLVERGIPHGIAGQVSEHIDSGGTSLSVEAANSEQSAEFKLIIESFGGQIVS